MPTPETMSSQSNTAADTQKRKRSLLNKFLAKTYHMIDQCDPSIASWSRAGDSFTVNDISRFQEEVLPKYFNHSKFSSFIRQLNFYGFQKLRSDPDLQVHTERVRFSHEFFKRGCPELLHKIQRTTAGKPSRDVSLSTDKVETLQEQVDLLKAQVSDMEKSMNKNVESAVLAVEKKYTLHIQRMEASYEALFSTLLQKYKRDSQQQQSHLTALPLLQPTELSKSLPPTHWAGSLPLDSNNLTEYLRSKRGL